MNHVRTTLSERYTTVVSEMMGLPYEIDDEGTLCFEHHDEMFYLDNHAPGDPEYFRLHTGLGLDEATLALDLTGAAAEATRRAKGAKIVVVDQFVVASVELVLAAPDCLPSVPMIVGVLPRAMLMIRAGLSMFATAVHLAGIEAATGEFVDDHGDQAQ